jgi:hypothetical protein
MIPIPMTGLTAEKRRRVEQWANLKTCAIVYKIAHCGWTLRELALSWRAGSSWAWGEWPNGASPYRPPCWTVRSALERAAQQPADDIYRGCYGHNQSACMTAATHGRQGPALHVNSSLVGLIQVSTSNIFSVWNLESTFKSIYSNSSSSFIKPHLQ